MVCNFIFILIIVTAVFLCDTSENQNFIMHLILFLNLRGEDDVTTFFSNYGDIIES